MAKLFLKADVAKDQNDEARDIKFYFDENERLVIKLDKHKVTISEEDTKDLRAFIHTGNGRGY